MHSNVWSQSSVRKPIILWCTGKSWALRAITSVLQKGNLSLGGPLPRPAAGWELPQAQFHVVHEDMWVLAGWKRPQRVMVLHPALVQTAFRSFLSLSKDKSDPTDFRNTCTIAWESGQLPCDTDLCVAQEGTALFYKGQHQVAPSEPWSHIFWKERLLVNIQQLLSLQYSTSFSSWSLSIQLDLPLWIFLRAWSSQIF